MVGSLRHLIHHVSFSLNCIFTSEQMGFGYLQERDVREESGWKLVHGDVFRSPQNLVLLSALVGTGAQLAMLILLVILLAIVGMLYVGYVVHSISRLQGLLRTAISHLGWYALFLFGYLSMLIKSVACCGGNRRGAIVTTFIVCYALTAFISGYVSGGFYSRNEGKNLYTPSSSLCSSYHIILLMVTSPLIICLSLKKMIICSSHWFDNPVNLSNVHLLGQGNTGSNPCYLQLLCFHSYASALVSFWMLLPSSIIHWQRSHLALWLVMQFVLPHKCPIFPASERSSLPKKSISNIIPKFSGTWYNMTNCAY